MAAVATFESVRLRVVPSFRWAAVLAAIIVCVAGAFRSGIFHQAIWDPIGKQRVLLYTALFATAAILIFVIHRAALLPWFGGSTLIYTVALTGAKTILALLFFTLACYGIGCIVFRVLRLGVTKLRRPLLIDVLACVVGAGLWGFVMSFLAFTSWNRQEIHALVLAVPAIAGGWFIWSRRGLAIRSPRICGHAIAEYWAIALLLYVLGAQFLMSLKPEVSADGIAVQLVVPMHIASHHSWHFDVSQISWAVSPMTAEWCFTTLYLLGGEFAAKLLPFVFLSITCILIVLLCQRMVPRAAALLIAAVYAATPAVQLITGAMFVDTLWTGFLLAAVVVIVHWTESRDTAALTVAGVLLGSAMATKLVGLTFVVLCFAWVLVNSFGRKSGIDRKSLAALLAAAVLCVIVAAPPYVTAWVKTGNPVFPYFNDVFRSPHYDTKSDWADPRWQTRLSWRAPFDVTFRSSTFLESQNGAVGLSWLFLIMLFAAAPRSMFTRPVIAALSIGVPFLLVTWTRASYIRYIVPAFPLLLFGFASYLRVLRTTQSNLYRTVVGATVAAILSGVFLLPSSGYWHKNFCLNPLDFDAEAEEYIAQNAPARLLVAYLNRMAPGQPAAFFSNGIAGLRGRSYTSGAHTYEFFSQLAATTSAEAVKELMVKNGIRHFITPVPKCGEPNLPQLTQFIEQYTEERFRRGCLYVAEMKPDPPEILRAQRRGVRMASAHPAR